MKKTTNTQSSVVLKEIADGDVRSAANFLHEYMNSQLPVAQWQRAMETNWLEDAPNHGFILKEGDRIVGILCAIYSKQMVNGAIEKFCNPHSWCVLPEYRAKSVQLVLAVIKQKGFHFTMFSANQSGIEIFSFLKFKPMDSTVIVYPAFFLFGGGDTIRIVDDRKESIENLPASVGKVYKHHWDYPWIKSIVFGSEGRYCLVLYKKKKFKRLPSARIIYVSDPDLFHDSLPVLKKHFLVSRGIFTYRIENRLLTKPVGFELGRQQGHQKLYLSDALSEKDIQNVYSELVVLDI